MERLELGRLIVREALLPTAREDTAHVKATARTAAWCALPLLRCCWS
jgi:hypothetical protein